MKYSKGIAGILLATTLTTMGVVGCGSIDHNAVAISVGSEEISMGAANFYTRFQGAMTETYYMSMLGVDMWETEVGEGQTYQESVREQVQTTLKELLVVKQHAKELGVELAKEDTDKIKKTAKEFVEANQSKEVSQAVGTQEQIEEVLTLFALDAKCRPVIVKDIDRDIADKDAAQKKTTYVSFSTMKTENEQQVAMSDDEKKKVKEQAEDLLTDAVKSKDLKKTAEDAELKPLETTFDSSSKNLPEDLITALDKIKKDEFTAVIETESAYYIAQLTSEMDKDATKAKKESMITEREDEEYRKTVDSWVEKADIEINKSQWKKIDLQDLGVTMKQPEVENPEVEGLETEASESDKDDTEKESE